MRHDARLPEGRLGDGARIRFGASNRHHRMPVSQLMWVRLGGGAPTVKCVSGHLGKVLVLRCWAVVEFGGVVCLVAVLEAEAVFCAHAITETHMIMPSVRTRRVPPSRGPIM
jgi:hypothetical protein